VNLVVMTAVVALILIGIAVAVANADAGMPDAPRDLPDTGIPAGRQMTPDDVEALRFSMAPRGYRMAEVDEAMARLRDELAARDAEIEQLRDPASQEQEQPEEFLELRAETDSNAESATTETHG
jgi:DivIVA domain-containing protein